MLLTEANRSKPRWAKLSEVQQKDLEDGKAAWSYPRNTYERLLQLYNSNRYNESASKVIKAAN